MIKLLIINHRLFPEFGHRMRISDTKDIFKENHVNELPSHLKFDSSKLEATVLDYCDRNDLALQLDELLVIEYYSRR